jgi:hypothetical protein
MNERRQFFRKTLNFEGQLVRNDLEFSFRTSNLSIRGLKAKFEQNPALQIGDMVRINLPILSIGGIASVVWLSATEEGEYLAGLSFECLDGLDSNLYRFRND